MKEILLGVVIIVIVASFIAIAKTMTNLSSLDLLLLSLLPTGLAVALLVKAFR